MFEAYTFKFHGVTGFNANGWLAGAGDGYYYVPVKKTIKGKKVNALRVGEGAGNYFVSYAYQNKKLIKIIYYFVKKAHNFIDEDSINEYTTTS